jgi:hypothetical protein
MRFIAVDVGLDYRVVQRDGQPAIEFSFDGTDECDRTNGRGWAALTGDELHGRIFFHHGEASAVGQCGARSGRARSLRASRMAC